MSKSSVAARSLPQESIVALQRLGGDLAIARLRRGESLRSWAQRVGVSVPTLMKVERGDPGVGIGIYATALWLVGRGAALGEVAAPEADRAALEAEVRAAAASRSDTGPKARRGNAGPRESTP